MRTAALLAKAVARNAEALPAHAALRMATLAGAQAIGLEARVGSIEPGKAADLVAVELRAPELAPVFDPVSHLVYAAGREQVSHVWVDGKMRVEEGKLQGKLLGEGFSRLDSRWELWQNALKSRVDS
jgi:5-methylthioadenosine/S-adenosylhomocysteine deaminase